MQCIHSHVNIEETGLGEKKIKITEMFGLWVRYFSFLFFKIAYN